MTGIMNKIQVENLEYENITLYVNDTDDGIEILFQGSIDMEYPHERLDPYFNQIHEAVIQKRIKHVYCNFKELQYINSSGIRSIIKWILELKGLKDTDNFYNMTLVISSEHKWQVASFEFIAKISPAVIQIKK